MQDEENGRRERCDGQFPIGEGHKDAGFEKGGKRDEQEEEEEELNKQGVKEFIRGGMVAYS